MAKARKSKPFDAAKYLDSDEAVSEYISEALLTFLRPVMDGSDAWDANPTIRLAIEIREGVIKNPAILSFQGRSPLYPHLPLATRSEEHNRVVLGSRRRGRNHDHLEGLLFQELTAGHLRRKDPDQRRT